MNHKQDPFAHRNVLLHVTATVMASQPLPGADAAYAAGARGFYATCDKDVWLNSLGGLGVTVEPPILLEREPIKKFSESDVRLPRIFATSPTLVSVTYFR